MQCVTGPTDSARGQHERVGYKFTGDFVVKKTLLTATLTCTLSHSTLLRNAIGPQVFEELTYLLNSVRHDNSRVLLISSSMNVFCSGLDLHYFLKKHFNTTEKMLDALRLFLLELTAFPKPIVLGVNGAAVGLGAALLPLCDVVYASDKAVFSMPYAQLGQTPEAGASHTLPSLLGGALIAEEC
ncbi:PREDICTED: testis-specific chromodomain protein Y 1-like [Priapulus caudatus]|uniref:Testis-specific chromodomain protein Y 1-like n=1 Tax=Priapulus caudatus TaxID=37621 RepID=A0ABM1EC25_PRICU|nr:PREDICTED: testis-specific chromodomain protein Y 1-like [Priapulus caudatus]